jgi:hypothetical protein
MHSNFTSTANKLLEEITSKGTLKKGTYSLQINYVFVHVTEPHCNMRLTGHTTLNFSNSMSMVAGFLDVEKAFNTTWHHRFLYKDKAKLSLYLIEHHSVKTWESEI